MSSYEHTVERHGTTGVSSAAEDYVKTIYSLTQGIETPAAMSILAERLGVSMSTASTTVKRLDTAGLAQHVPYRGVRLTASGQRLALRMVRRHRMIELFLATYLDIAWEDVHRFADSLEHAASDELVEIMAHKLGEPTVDPHGSPIPSRELEVADDDTRSLADLPPGQQATVARVSAPDPAMLRYLSEVGIGIGVRVRMVSREPFDGPCHVEVAEQRRFLGPSLAGAIRVR